MGTNKEILSSNFLMTLTAFNLSKNVVCLRKNSIVGIACKSDSFPFPIISSRFDNTAVVTEPLYCSSGSSGAGKQEGKSKEEGYNFNMSLKPIKMLALENGGPVIGRVDNGFQGIVEIDLVDLEKVDVSSVVKVKGWVLLKETTECNEDQYNDERSKQKSNPLMNIGDKNYVNEGEQEGEIDRTMIHFDNVINRVDTNIENRCLVEFESEVCVSPKGLLAVEKLNMAREDPNLNLIDTGDESKEEDKTCNNISDSVKVLTNHKEIVTSTLYKYIIQMNRKKQMTNCRGTCNMRPKI